MNIAEYRSIQKTIKPKKKFPEYEEQIKVVNWWYNLKQMKVIPAHYHLVYTDTSASRTPAQRDRYAKMGGRAGVLDLFIPVPKIVSGLIVPLSFNTPSQTIYNSLWIEMKAPDRINEKDGGMSKEQVKFASDVLKSGNLAIVCHTAKQAQDEISKYLELKI